VGQGGGVPGLVAEAGEEVLVAGVLALEDLGRDDAVQDLVAGLPDLTHAARRDRGHDLVPAGQQAADGERHQSS
jgi:hypothetical protein